MTPCGKHFGIPTKYSIIALLVDAFGEPHVGDVSNMFFQFGLVRKLKTLIAITKRT